MDFNLDVEINSIIQQYLNDLSKLIEVKSVKDSTSVTTNKPFGEGISKAMDVFKEISESLGFKVVKHDGYAIDARTSDDSNYIGILGHLDVVDILYPDEWVSNPFELTMRDSVLYGRGVNDDKGPLLMCLYVVKMLKDKGQLTSPIRVIAGGDEENDWNCVEHYFTKELQPIMAFSPDGNFPVVNGEKGILQFRFILDYNSDVAVKSLNAQHTICDHFVVGNDESFGKTALSRNPQRADNAIFKFIEQKPWPEDLTNVFNFIKNYLIDYSAKDIGLFSEDDEMGQTSLAVTHVYSQNDKLIIQCDFRYPRTLNKDRVVSILETFAEKEEIDFEVELSREYLYVEPNDKLVQSCLKAYETVTGKKEEPITKGGASYARALKKGIAFGATFEYDDPRPHMPNENMSLESIKKAMKIYYHALFNLIND